MCSLSGRCFAIQLVLLQDDTLSVSTQEKDLVLVNLLKALSKRCDWRDTYKMDLVEGAGCGISPLNLLRFPCPTAFASATSALPSPKLTSPLPPSNPNHRHLQVTMTWTTSATLQLRMQRSLNSGATCASAGRTKWRSEGPPVSWLG